MSTNTLNKQEVRIGFLGLGLMGSRLTERIHAAGWKVQAWNRSSEPARAMAAKGIPIAESIAKLVVDSDVVISSLANDAAVESVDTDAGGVLSSASAGHDCAGDEHHLAAAVAATAPEGLRQGIRMLGCGYLGIDAGGGGGSDHPACGRGRDTFEQCMPIYESIARQWFLIGGPFLRSADEAGGQPAAGR